MTSTRKHRRELTDEIAKLRGLQQHVHPTLDDASARALARQIRDQAEICLDLLDQYQASVPGRMWSYTERTCHPLRQDLRRTAMHFRAASGEWGLRTGEQAWGRSWWNSTDLDFPYDEIIERDGRTGTSQVLNGPDSREGGTALDTLQPVEVVLSGLEFDPDPQLLSPDPAKMMTFVTILVGPPSGGGELFRATLCTPEWIAVQRRSASVMPGTGLLIVRSENFDERRVRRAIERFLARIQEETWGDAAKRIKEWFPHREFDG